MLTFNCVSVIDNLTHEDFIANHTDSPRKLTHSKGLLLQHLVFQAGFKVSENMHVQICVIDFCTCSPQLGFSSLHLGVSSWLESVTDTEEANNKMSQRLLSFFGHKASLCNHFDDS